MYSWWPWWKSQTIKDICLKITFEKIPRKAGSSCRNSYLSYDVLCYKAKMPKLILFLTRSIFDFVLQHSIGWHVQLIIPLDRHFVVPCNNDCRTDCKFGSWWLYNLLCIQLFKIFFSHLLLFNLQFMICVVLWGPTVFWQNHCNRVRRKVYLHCIPRPYIVRLLDACCQVKPSI